MRAMRALRFREKSHCASAYCVASIFLQDQARCFVVTSIFGALRAFTGRGHANALSQRHVVALQRSWARWMRSWRDLTGNVGERVRFCGSQQRFASKYADACDHALEKNMKMPLVVCL